MTATLNEASDSETTITVSATPVAPAAADDFTLSSDRTLTIAAGSTSSTGQVTITAVDNAVEEADKTVRVSGAATNPTGVTGPADVSLTITDDDDTPPRVPVVTLRLSPTSISENGGVSRVTATLNEASHWKTTITVSATPVAPAAAEDFTLSSDRTLTIAAGSTTSTGQVTITGVDNAVEEADKTVRVSGAATNFRGVTGPRRVSLTITDDDGTSTVPAVTLRLSPTSISENGGVSRVTATLDEASDAETTITVSAAPVAPAAADDFTLSSDRTLTIAAGSTTSTGRVAITGVDNAVEEADKTVRVSGAAANPSGVTGPADVSLTITDDDGTSTVPAVTLRLSPTSISENGGVSRVTATLNEASDSETTITVSAAPVAPAAAEDFTLSSDRTLTIAAGSTASTGRVTITGVDNAVDAADKTVRVSGAATNPTGVTGPADVSLTITDDDDTPPTNTPPTVLASCEPCEVAPGGESRLTATANDPDGDPLTYVWNAHEGSFRGATDGSTARWTAPGESGPVTVRVRVADGRGGSASATVVVVVANWPPVFEEAIYYFELQENLDGRRNPVELGRATATDPEGDELTYELVSGNRELFAIGARDGVVRYVGPGEDFESEPNRYELRVRARDPHGGEVRARVIVTVIDVNEPPAARDDEATTPEDQAVTVDVLANDTDADGNGLRIGSVSIPRHGTTAIAAGGVLYTPEADYHGADSFTYVASDPAGWTATATVRVTVLPVNDAPVAVGTIPDQFLDEGGYEETVELTPFFDDIDGDALTFRARSSNTDVVTVTVAGAVLTLTPVVYGSASVTVTAADPGGLTATQTFAVGVDDRLIREVLWNTLAAMARSHLASARMALGRRAAADAREGPRLTLLGRPVPLGRSQARAALARTLAAWAPGAGAYGGRTEHPGPETAAGDGLDATGLGTRRPDGMRPGIAGGSSGLGGVAGLGGLGTAADPLRGSEFMLAWGGEEDPGNIRPGRRWQVWGQGDVQSFAGAPSARSAYDGDLRTSYVGVDTRLTERLLTGVAVSRSHGGGAWRVGPARGSLSTTMTAGHPYVQWSDGAHSVWAMAGGGRGTAENVREATGLVGTSRLDLRLGMVEVRRGLDPVGGMRLGVRADTAWAQLATGAGRETVDAQTAAVNQARVGVEVSHPRRLDNGLSLSPFGELHVRRDGGAGQTGAGVEFLGGVRAAGGRVRIDAQGRMLALHSATGYRERGAAVTLSVGSRNQEGLSLSVSPRWGDAAAGGGALWEDQVYRRYRPDAAGHAWALDARAEYGTRLRGGRLLKWFGSLSQSHYGPRFLVGGRVAQAGR